MSPIKKNLDTWYNSNHETSSKNICLQHKWDKVAYEHVHTFFLIFYMTQKTWCYSRAINLGIYSFCNPGHTASSMALGLLVLQKPVHTEIWTYVITKSMRCIIKNYWSLLDKHFPRFLFKKCRVLNPEVSLPGHIKLHNFLKWKYFIT